MQVVGDAGGSPTKAADDAALRRMEKHGVVDTSTNQVMAELATEWASKIVPTIQAIMDQESLRYLVEA